MKSDNPEAVGFFTLVGIALILSIIFHIIFGFEDETQKQDIVVDPCSRVPAILLPYDTIKKCIKNHISH